MKRRQFLHLAAGACALPLASSVARADDATSRRSPLAARLAAYADGLRYDDLDDATIERVKVHLIDALGCGLAAFDEKPVRICRDVVLATVAAARPSSAPRGAPRPILRPSPMAPRSAISTSMTPMSGRITGHPSDNIAACLAVAEAERASTAELITADRPCLRGQLPTDRRLRRQTRRPRLGRSGAEPARRRARRRQADEASSRYRWRRPSTSR